MQLRVFIVDHLNSSEIKNHTEDIVSTEIKSDITTKNNKVKAREFNTEEKKIEALLNEYIAPAVEADGGAIILNYYKDNIVCVDLKGACSGCPSSTLTLKSGIESLLIQKMGEKVKEVVALNG